jgi:DNA-binding response OmpR family regulator
MHGYRVSRDGQEISLSRTEFNLLSLLAQHPGQTFTRAQLLNRLHGIAYDGYDRSIDAHIKNLRRKLEPDPANPQYIQTVYGVGYRFEDEGG